MNDMMLFDFPDFFNKKIRKIKHTLNQLKTVDMTKVSKFDTLMNSHEVARVLNITERTVRNLQLKRISSVKLSERKIYYTDSVLKKFINQNYYPAQVVDEAIPPELSIKEKLLTPSEVRSFIRHLSTFKLSKYREERRIGFVKLGYALYRYPERDMLLFVNRNYIEKLTYEE